MELLNPYFYKLTSTLLDAETERLIVDKAMENPEEFFAYKGQATGKEDGNYIFVKGFLRELEGVQRLIKSCTLECYPLVMKHHPNTPVPIHIDNPNGRNCVIISPLIPTTGYAPTHFWNSFDAAEPVATVEFDDMIPALINTQRLHSLTNNDNLRMNFQLCFTEPFTTVRELLQTGKLFKEVF